jgi:hypothetical protein
MRVNLRACDLDCAGPLVVRENQSRRPRKLSGQGYLKVAHYEVVGKGVKDSSVPEAEGTIEPSVLGSHTASGAQAANRSSLAGRVAFEKRDPPLRSGLLSNVPPGRGPLRMLFRLMLTRMGSSRTFLKSIRPGRGRDDRRMLPIAELRAKWKAKCFDRPCGTDLPLLHFPALRTGLLSLSPSGTKVHLSGA